MADEITKEIPPERGENRSWIPWFIGGLSVSFLALCSLVLLTLLIASTAVNAYLAWELSGLEVVVIRPTVALAQARIAEPDTPLVTIITATPTPTAAAITTAEEAGPEAVASEPTAAETAEDRVALPATATATARLMPPPVAVAVVTATPTPTVTSLETAIPAADSAQLDQAAAAAPGGGASQQRASGTSSNRYELIPINGERESRPAAEHADLNLLLRDPQPSDAPAELVDFSGYEDPNAPNLGKVFDQNFTRTYTVHDWDWACNCIGPLKTDGFLLGIKTTPGDPIFIPPVPKDLWEGRFYAVVLYASEDSLTFVYDRAGTVANSYAIHYLGLQTDPNLLQAFRQSRGNELPGLELDVPVGIATDELIVSVRDKGTFMDTRSRKDWWD